MERKSLDLMEFSEPMFHVSSSHQQSSERGENNTDNTNASLKSYESLINERWSYLGRDVFDFSEQTPYFINKTAKTLELEGGARLRQKKRRIISPNLLDQYSCTLIR